MIYEKSVADTTFMRGEYELAAKMYYEGARDGHIDAAFNYGYCLMHGYGVKQSYSEAKSFFSYARDLEGGAACYNLAMLYLEGNGVEKSYKTALSYMTAAADLGCIEAQLYLGMAYTTGYMMYPEVVSISMIPYHKSEYRDNTAPLLFGEVADAELDEDRRFRAVRQDAHLAFRYFKLAAHHDPTYVEELVAKGQYLYAKCYADGLGTDFNRDKSIRLMFIAGKSGSEDAIRYLSDNEIDKSRILAAFFGEGKK